MQHLLSSLGPVVAIIGAQWGDEGKGKVIDMLAEQFTVVARACGGANAGHTIVVNGKKTVFRLLPSGSLHDRHVFLGSGMVIHLPTLLEEIAFLKKEGIDIVPRLVISPKAHVVFDYHKEIDGALEDRMTQKRGSGIGTTRKGIGPAYTDKVMRTGLQIVHVFSVDVRKALESRAEDIERMYGVTIDAAAEAKACAQAKKLLAHRVMPIEELLAETLDAGGRVLVEGAQATLLDIDHGTYPYVTSSSTTVAGALQGLGLAPKRLTGCIGVAKAYCTRVGNGAFAAEADTEAGDRLRERGGEYGSVTGRPRRCGWLSVPDLRYAAVVNGFDCWNLTKLDVLDTEKVIPVCVAMDGEKPVFEELPGWQTSTAGITEWGELPVEAQRYVECIEEKTGVPVRLIGTGQGREAMIVR